MLSALCTPLHTCTCTRSIRAAAHTGVASKRVALGYRRRATGGTWLARRRRPEGGYAEHKHTLAHPIVIPRKIWIALASGVERSLHTLAHLHMHTLDQGGCSYWRGLEKGLALGYRRRATGGTWLARRRRPEGGYAEHKLGLSDDLQAGDGASVPASVPHTCTPLLHILHTLAHPIVIPRKIWIALASGVERSLHTLAHLHMHTLDQGGCSYWRGLEKGLALGYRRRATGGTWLARRRRPEGGYAEHKLGLSDDLQAGDGASVPASVPHTCTPLLHILHTLAHPIVIPAKSGLPWPQVLSALCTPLHTCTCTRSIRAAAHTGVASKRVSRVASRTMAGRGPRGAQGLASPTRTTATPLRRHDRNRQSIPRPPMRVAGVGAAHLHAPFAHLAHSCTPHRNTAQNLDCLGLRCPSLSRPAQASLALRPVGLLNRPRRLLSRGFNLAGCPAKSLVSYQINRQLSGWNLPPLVTRAFGAHCMIRVRKR